ncbi:MAG: hypothetical protein V1811_00170, partial [Candidatus Micrarchaeota archaeon]
ANSMVNKNARLNTVFHFTAHQTAGDLKRAVGTIEKFKPHVVCIEAAFIPGEEAHAIERNFEHGIIGYGSPFNVHLARYVRNAQAKLFMLERYSKDQSAKGVEKLNAADELAEEARQHILAGRPKEALETYGKVFEADAEIDALRENHVKKNISQLQGLLLSNYPELAREKEIRVMIVFGRAHTGIYHHAKREGIKSRIETEFGPFNPANELLRKRSFGLVTKPTPLDIAKAALGGLLVDLAIGRGESNFIKIAGASQKKTRALNLEQFKLIVQRVPKLIGEGKNESEAISQAIDEVLK